MKQFDFSVSGFNQLFEIRACKFHTAMHKLGEKLESNRVVTIGRIIVLKRIWTIKKKVR